MNAIFTDLSGEPFLLRFLWYDHVCYLAATLDKSRGRPVTVLWPTARASSRNLLGCRISGYPDLLDETLLSDKVPEVIRVHV